MKENLFFTHSLSHYCVPWTGREKFSDINCKISTRAFAHDEVFSTFQACEKKTKLPVGNTWGDLRVWRTRGMKFDDKKSTLYSDKNLFYFFFALTHKPYATITSLSSSMSSTSLSMWLPSLTLGDNLISRFSLLSRARRFWYQIFTRTPVKSSFFARILASSVLRYVAFL